MGLFSKLFGYSTPKSELQIIPEGEEITSRETIAAAISAVIQYAGGNCATLYPVKEPDKWVQVMESTINYHYPHQNSPDQLFPELCDDPIISDFEALETGVYLTLGLRDMNQPEIARWIERYFSQVLSVDLDGSTLGVRMEFM